MQVQEEELRILSFVFMSFNFLTLVSCGLTRTAPTQNIDFFVEQTQTAVTVEHFLTATQLNQNVSEIIPVTPQLNVAQIPSIPPSPTIQLYCADKAILASNDETGLLSVSSGASFQHSWTVRNTGTCTWNKNYSIVFVGGEKFSAQDRIPLTIEVPPESETQITLSFLAPQTPGYYEGFWKLQNEKNTQFGLGESGDAAFWLKVNVSSETPSNHATATITTSDLKEPVWKDSFDPKTTSFFIGKGNDVGFELHDGKLVITAFHPVGDLWKVARYPEIGTFNLQSINTIGNTCSGKDGYGLIVRAPNQPDNIIDSGYVFGISCDGMFRVYKMEKGRYIRVQEWTPSEFIKQGPNQTNKLGVKAIGDHMEFFVNDQKIYEYWDSKFPIGLFGIMIRSEYTSNLTLFVDEIGYWSVTE